MDRPRRSTRLLCILATGLGVAHGSASGSGPDGAPSKGERPRLLERAIAQHACFPIDLGGADLEQAMERWELLPPALAATDDRFFIDTKSWTGDGQIGDAGRAQPAHLTYSFPADGTTWGISTLFFTGPNVLNSEFTQLFGAGNEDLGRELVRQSLATYRRWAGLTYTEVADDGSALDMSSGRVITRGDIRIGGLDYPAETFLAYNAFPSLNGTSSTGGGDMVLNTIQFIPGRFNDPANNYRYFRNTIAHEHGHGLGAIHVTPCNGSKLMEPFIILGQDLLAIDDRRGAARNYGDRYAGNQGLGTPHDLGNLTTPTLRSAILRGMSTNGSTGAMNSKEDWYRITISSTQTLVITAEPMGGTYPNGQQTSMCNPSSPPNVNASAAGDLRIELRTFNGLTQLAFINAQGPGGIEILNAGSWPAGTYLVKVTDVGPSTNQEVQLYDLTIRVGGALAPPDAIAGISKRVRFGTNCYFMGDVNSSATEAGATIVSYDWDLDGDGMFETLNNPQPVTQYPSNGIYNVSLRVTDSNGLSAIDTIPVEVYGATGSVVVTPNSGAPGASVPVTITGANLMGVDDAADVTVSGSGVTVSGTPVTSPLGNEITGLSFNVSGGAFPGARNVTVQSSSGPVVGSSAFTVEGAPPQMPGPFSLQAPPLGQPIPDFSTTLQWSASTNAFFYNLTFKSDLNGDGSFETTILLDEQNLGTSRAINSAMLRPKTAYYWTVVAVNTFGSTNPTPVAATFRTPTCPGDANYDKLVNFDDIGVILSAWGALYFPGASGTGDANSDDVVDFQDINSTLTNWLAPCP